MWSRMGLLLFVLLVMNSYGGAVKDWYLSIPAQILDWKVKEKDQVFNRETIFKHIDGGAELYLTYDFKQVFVRKFLGPGDSELVLDIYDMGSAQEAFGIFSSEREDDEAGIGQGSEYGEGLLRFWKDRYFVSVLAIGDDPKAESAVLQLGRAVAGAIGSTGAEPALVKCLPPKNLDRSKIRYFHADLILNKHYYLANENILNLGRKTDCLLAEYPLPGQEPVILLLVQYENGHLAREAYENFLKVYLPEARATGIARLENQKWTMIKIEQNMVSIVFEAPDREGALELQSALKFFGR